VYTPDPKGNVEDFRSSESYESFQLSLSFSFNSFTGTELVKR
jgi:hypothetical protein